MKSNVTDYDLIVVHSTDFAVLVKDDEDADPVWLPKSQIELDHDDTGPCCVTIPDWLAEERGLA
ncbi:hypothetical protein [Sediminimonas sp.]|uniref:hypothetical protein n=1 Tax=Sediminimonas sp. TaxID=2823379 RepID=UPI0025F54689|nr:hypothetical protein [Sediminimonas sp.]